MLIYELNGYRETEKSLFQVLEEFNNREYAMSVIKNAKTYLSEHPNETVIRFECFGFIHIYNSKEKEKGK